jgi:hypothetical protein
VPPLTKMQSGNFLIFLFFAGCYTTHHLKQKIGVGVGIRAILCKNIEIIMAIGISIGIEIVVVVIIVIAIRHKLSSLNSWLRRPGFVSTDTIQPSIIVDRKPIDIQLLVTELHLFSDYDYDNDNDNDSDRDFDFSMCCLAIAIEI